MVTEICGFGYSSTAVGHVTIDKEDYRVLYLSSAPNTSNETYPASGERTVSIRIQ